MRAAPVVDPTAAPTVLRSDRTIRAALSASAAPDLVLGLVFLGWAWRGRDA